MSYKSLYQAHKVILSACSPFFRGVLRKNKHEHPLLYLKVTSSYFYKMHGTKIGGNGRNLSGGGRASW